VELHFAVGRVTGWFGAYTYLFDSETAKSRRRGAQEHEDVLKGIP